MSDGYTLDQWMRGVPPPAPKPGARRYVYGVGVIRDKLVPFVFRSGGRPSGNLRILEEHEVGQPIDEVMRLRDELLAKHQEKRKEMAFRAISDAQQAREKEIYRLEIGRVAAHSDGQSIHMAILLDPGPESFALFLTSRPGWAKKFRPITQDERVLVGLRTNEKMTFLAPVIRPRDEFSLTHRQFPESRVADLLLEFQRNDAC